MSSEEARRWMRWPRPSPRPQANWLGPDQRAAGLVAFDATGDLGYKTSTWILGLNTLSTSLPQVRRQPSGQYRIESAGADHE